MWLAVPEWMIVDDEPPMPTVGSVLRSVGLLYATIEPATKPRGVVGIEA